MAKVLHLSGSGYNGVVNYLKSISSRGAVVNDVHIYQVAKYIGRGLILANPGEETITLEDNVTNEVVESILKASRPRWSGIL